MQKFRKVLICNRGEIARRIMQACQELEIEVMAIYSKQDANSPHLKFANQTVEVSSYLNIEELVQVAINNNCDAVHPGYGFLSERSNAAEAFSKAKIKWIGPSSATIDALGNKLASKSLVEEAKVPTLSWKKLAADNLASLQQAASEIGYPILLKAASGGGGKGMRLVDSENQLQEAAEGAAREAESAFGDATVFLEKYLENPKHIEVQILGDSHGNAIHLGERDCSSQRRHQKVIEEAPATSLSEETKQKIQQAAVQVAKKANYENAGTVEFLVDKNHDFYFLEMNSRLQVEHSVTEAVWGVDLVKAQLKIAMGAKISDVWKSKIHARGHAIEARIYAENAEKAFAPSPGKLLKVEWPQGPGIRIDESIQAGMEIGLDYDPMLGKITCVDESREAAIEKLIWSLQNTIIFGITTNINYLQDILKSEIFRTAKMHVKYLESQKWTDPIPEILETNKESLFQDSDSIASPSTFATNTDSYASPWEGAWK